MRMLRVFLTLLLTVAVATVAAGRAAQCPHSNGGPGELLGALAPCTTPKAVGVGDVTADALNDIVAACDDGLYVFPASGSAGAVTFGSGITRVHATSASSRGLVLVDLNNDTAVDLVVKGEESGTLFVLQNTIASPGASPSFALVGSFGISTGNSAGPRMYDVDGDGLVDVFVPEAYKFGGWTAVWFRNVYARGVAGGPVAFDSTKISVGSATLNWVRDAGMGDLDGDGDLDAVVSYKWGLGLTYNLDGAGTSWSSWSDYRSHRITGGNGEVLNWGSVHILDVDGDGDQDIVGVQVSNMGMWMVENLLDRNSSAPSMADELVRIVPYLGTPWWGTVLVDFDNDGQTNDILMTNPAASAVTIVHNLGIDPRNASAGVTATRISPIRVSASVVSAAFGDVDSDGDNDILASSDDSKLWWVSSGMVSLTPDWTGVSFNAPMTLPRSVTTRAKLDVLDADQDGDMDILGGGSSGTHTLFPNAGDGTFATSIDISFTTPSDQLEPRDLNLDGILDFTIVDAWVSPSFLIGNDISSQIEPFDAVPLPATESVARRTSGATWGDVTGDGAVDFVWYDIDSQNMYLEINAGQPLDSYGLNTTVLGSSGAASGFSKPYVLDYDGDGDNDVVMAHSHGQKLMAWENLANGTSWSGMINVRNLPDRANRNLAFGDLDGDGDAFDFVVGYYRQWDEDVYWYRHNPAGKTWDSILLLDASATGWQQNDGHAGVGDFEGDGTLDIAVPAAQSNTGPYAVILFFNPDGDGSFDFATRTTTISVPTMPTAALVADLNGDGVTDLVVGTDPEVFVYTQVVTERFQFLPQTRTFDPATCGYSMACVANAISSLSACASHTTLLLPPGRYYGCFSAARGPYVLDGVSLTVAARDGAGTVTIDCDAHVSNGVEPGVLFAVSSRSGATSVTLKDLAVVGGSAATAASVNSLLTVSGGETELTLDSVTVTAVNTSNAEDGSRGAVLSIRSGAQVTLDSVTVTGVTGAVRGGVAAVEGSGTRLSVSNSTFTSVGCGGDGGVFYVNAVSGASLVVSNSTFASNTAGGAGGVVYVELPDAPTGASVLFLQCSFAGHRARYGGLFAVASREWVSRSALLGTTFALSNPMQLPLAAAGSVGAPSTSKAGLAVSGAVFGPGNSASFGGAVFGCGGSVSVGLFSLAGPGPALPFEASTGSMLFTCSPSAAGDIPAAGGLAPVIVGAGASVLEAQASTVSGASRYGVPAATPATVLELATAPPTGRMTGVPLGSGSVRATDAHGSLVSEQGTSVFFTVSPAGNFSLAGSAPLAREMTSAAGISFGDIGIYARAADVWAESGQNPVATVTAVLDGPARLTVSFDVAVQACEAGYGLASLAGEPVTCAACPSSQTSTTTSLAPCEPIVTCPDGSIVIEQECVTCPSGADRAPPSSSLFTNSTVAGVPPCICMFDFYSPGGTIETACTRCPEGGVCTGGLSRPSSQEGFYMVSDGANPVFDACVRPGACPGDNTCAAGYTGVGCRECASGYYSTPELECASCPGVSWLMFAAMWTMLVIVVVLWTVFLSCIDSSLSPSTVSRGAGAGADGRPGLVRSRTSWAVMRTQQSQSHRARVPFALSAAIVFVQVVGIIGTTSQLLWPESTKQAFQIMNVANFETSYLAAECVLDDFVMRYSLRTMYPLMMTLLFIPLAAILKSPLACSYRMKAPLSAILEKTVVVMGPMMYISLSRASLVLFDCTRTPEGGYVYDADPSVECYKGEWLTVLPIGIVALVVFTIGIPLYLAVRVFRVRHRLSESSVLAVYGTMYSLYRHRYWYFELTRLFQRLCIVVLALFLSAWPFWQIMGLASVFGLYLVVQLKIEPYFDPMYNHMDQALSGIILALLGIGFCFYADEFPSSGVRLAFEIALWTVLAIAILVLARNLMLELKLKRNANTRVTPKGSESGAAAATGLVKHTREAYVWEKMETHLKELYVDGDEVDDELLSAAILVLRTKIVSGELAGVRRAGKSGELRFSVELEAFEDMSGSSSSSSSNDLVSSPSQSRTRTRSRSRTRTRSRSPAASMPKSDTRPVSCSQIDALRPTGHSPFSSGE